MSNFVGTTSCRRPSTSDASSLKVTMTWSSNGTEIGLPNSLTSRALFLTVDVLQYTFGGGSFAATLASLRGALSFVLPRLKRTLGRKNPK